MKTDTQTGIHNALLRRVQRYAQTTAIFRAADWDNNLQSPTANPSSQPVRASWQTAPTSLPVGQAIAQAEMKPPSPSSELSLPAPPPPTRPAEPEPIATFTPAAAAVPDTMATPSPAPMVQKTPARQEDDANWSRLQRIMTMHEARATDEGSPTPSPASGLGAIVHPTETASPAAAETPIQHAIDAAESTAPPPLESVWPVQRKTPAPPKPPTATSTSSVQAVTPPAPELPAAAPPNPAAAETVRTKLNDVSAARRTDSSVELHLPRRPRPADIQAKKSPESANESFWNRLRGTKPQPDKRTVPTEIGPLPADMWEILGEAPPVQPEGGHAPAVQTMPDTVPPPTPAAIQRAAAAAEASPTTTTQTTPTVATEPPTAVSPTTPPTPAAIQRAAAAAEASP
ncbi:MAG: hypothetical protein ACE5EY_10080, partial [Anaerolineae bacterium]